MSKRLEYNIEFRSHTFEDGRKEPYFDTQNSEPQYRSLYFINSLQKCEVEGLTEDMDRIISGQFYDPDFLTSSEIYVVFNVQFIDPDFWVEGFEVINIFDLRVLLHEWLVFLEEFEIKEEPKQIKSGFFKKFINKFKLL